MPPSRPYSVSRQPAQGRPRPRSKRWTLARFSGLASLELPARITLLGCRPPRWRGAPGCTGLLQRCALAPVRVVLLPALRLAALGLLVYRSQRLHDDEVVGNLLDLPLSLFCAPCVAMAQLLHHPQRPAQLLGVTQ